MQKHLITIELSEYDRKTRRNLLAVSFISILIAALHITVKDPKIFGTTINGLTNETLSYALILMTVYYLAQYSYRFAISKMISELESLKAFSQEIDPDEYEEMLERAEANIPINRLNHLRTETKEDPKEHYIRNRQRYYKDFINQKTKSITVATYVFDLVLPILVAVTSIAMLISKNLV